MGCPHGSEEGSELAVSYIAGKLDPAAAAAFEGHLQACPECRRRTAGQQAVWSALDQWQPAPVSPGFDQRLFARLADPGQISRRLRLDWRSAIPVAAACAILAAAFVVKQPTLTPAQPSVRIEQVERALDDIDLLNRLNVPAPAKPGSAERI